MEILSRAKPLPDSRVTGIKMEEGWDVFSLLHKKDGKLQIKEAEHFGFDSSDYEPIKE